MDVSNSKADGLILKSKRGIDHGDRGGMDTETCGVVVEHRNIYCWRLFSARSVLG